MGKKTAIIIGFGGIGGAWLRAIKKHPDWECVGIVDVQTELLEHVIEEGEKLYGFDEAYLSIEEAVQYGNKPDLAVVATPIYTHHSLVREVMDLDINVICEKNMASAVFQGKQMVQAALDKPHLCTAVDTQYRYGMGPWTMRNFFMEDPCPIGTLGQIRWYSQDYRGEKRWGWRRWLQDIYLEDMSVHWFDTMRYVTGMDVVQVKADVFMPRYSEWHGSSTVYANIALAHPDDYNHRHNWVWCHFYGDWQARGPTSDLVVFYGSHGQMRRNDPWGLELKLYTDMNDTRKFEEDGYLPVADVENLGTNFTGQEIILEMMKRGIDSGGKQQPGTHFAEAFKSFSVAMACSESSRTGKTVWVPDYWKDMDI
ncbi:MAG: Gfo/Idh/MocA family protein [Promethearchaeota archaeon]